MPLKTKSAPKEHLGLTTRQKMKKYRAFYIMFIPLFLCLILFSYLPMFGILVRFHGLYPLQTGPVRWTAELPKAVLPGRLLEIVLQHPADQHYQAGD